MSPPLLPSSAKREREIGVCTAERESATGEAIAAYVTVAEPPCRRHRSRPRRCHWRREQRKNTHEGACREGETRWWWVVPPPLLPSPSEVTAMAAGLLAAAVVCGPLCIVAGEVIVAAKTTAEAFGCFCHPKPHCRCRKTLPSPSPKSGRRCRLRWLPWPLLS